MNNKFVLWHNKYEFNLLIAERRFQLTNKPKPDDRSDNVDRIQNNIDNTIANYRETKDIIKSAVNEKEKQDLLEKNKRREQSIKSMREEIRDEAIDKKNGYK